MSVEDLSKFNLRIQVPGDSDGRVAQLRGKDVFEGMREEGFCNVSYTMMNVAASTCVTPNVYFLNFTTIRPNDVAWMESHPTRPVYIVDVTSNTLIPEYQSWGGPEMDEVARAFYFDGEWTDTVERMLRLADGVTTSYAELVPELKYYNDNVMHLPDLYEDDLGSVRIFVHNFTEVLFRARKICSKRSHSVWNDHGWRCRLSSALSRWLSKSSWRSVVK